MQTTAIDMRGKIVQTLSGLWHQAFFSLCALSLLNSAIVKAQTVPSAPSTPVTVVAPASPPAPPCSAPEHKQFDFWIGDWDGDTTTPGAAPGKSRNRIERILGGCVIWENFESLPTLERVEIEVHRGSPADGVNVLVPGA